MRESVGGRGRVREGEGGCVVEFFEAEELRMRRWDKREVYKKQDE